jgi:hypothetical protein
MTLKMPGKAMWQDLKWGLVNQTWAKQQDGLYIPKQAFADLCAESLTLFPPSNGEP